MPLIVYIYAQSLIVYRARGMEFELAKQLKKELE
jgi:hypothetical protein